jgi:hypothetical protein
MMSSVLGSTYFVGAYQRTIYGGGIVIRTDTNGANPVFYVATGVQTRGITAPMLAFPGAHVKSGRLYLAGNYIDSSGSVGYLISHLDNNGAAMHIIIIPDLHRHRPHAFAAYH